MATNQTLENIAKTSTTGLRGILKIAGIKSEFLCSPVFIISIVIGIIFIFFVKFFQLNVYDLINEIKTIMIGFLPGILGFTIAGYALVVGFLQSNLLDKISERLELPDHSLSNYSLYQTMSSYFALNIIIQGISLIMAFTYHFFIYFETHTKNHINVSIFDIKIINWISLMGLSFLFIISLLLIVQIVINIFNFSQLHHYIINKSKIDDPK